MTGTGVRCRRAAQRTLAAVAACAAVLLAAVPSAEAGPISTIKTAPSPSSTGGPVQGGGSWITNKPSGYYLGRATTGSRFNLVPGHGATWHYGRAIDTVDLCGWVMPGSLGTRQGQSGDHREGLQCQGTRDADRHEGASDELAVVHLPLQLLPRNELRPWGQRRALGQPGGADDQRLRPLPVHDAGWPSGGSKGPELGVGLRPGILRRAADEGLPGQRLNPGQRPTTNKLCTAWRRHPPT